MLSRSRPAGLEFVDHHDARTFGCAHRGLPLPPTVIGLKARDVSGRFGPKPHTACKQSPRLQCHEPGSRMHNTTYCLYYLRCDVVYRRTLHTRYTPWPLVECASQGESQARPSPGNSGNWKKGRVDGELTRTTEATPTPAPTGEERRLSGTGQRALAEGWRRAIGCFRRVQWSFGGWVQRSFSISAPEQPLLCLLSWCWHSWCWWM